MQVEESGIGYITMPSYKIDKINLSSDFGAFINYANPTGVIEVAATSLANGASRTISTTIGYTRGGTVADIYATRSTVRTVITGGGRAAASAVYNFKSSETAAFTTTYSSSSITVSLIITNNTGGAITPNAQTITIDLAQYDAPIQSV